MFKVPTAGVEWEIVPERTALLVIDMQNDYCDPKGANFYPSTKEIVARVNRLTRACRSAGIPVIWTRCKFRKDGRDAGYMFHFRPVHAVEGTWGWQICDQMDVQDDDYTVDKCRYGAFIAGSSIMERLLRNLGKDTIIITGVTTNVCCESTAREAMQLDFKVIFMSDGAAAITKELHEASLTVLRRNFAQVIDTEQLVERISQLAAGNQEKEVPLAKDLR